jgi:hypothetical protein
MQGIAPMLIVARTSLGLSRPDTEWSTKPTPAPVMTTVEFSRSKITTSLSRTRGNSRFASETMLSVHPSEKSLGGTDESVGMP